MANLIGAAYKWRIDNNVYSYITNTEGGEPFIVSGSTECNEELIRNKVQNFTKEQYETKFQEMVSAVHAYNNGKYSYVQFLDYTIYMNECEHCDIYNRPDVVTDIDFTVYSTTLPNDSEATVGVHTIDEDIECREGEKIRKYHIDFGIPKGSSFIPIKVTDEELLQNGEQIIRENDILAGDFVVSVDSNTIWYCGRDYQFITSNVQLSGNPYRYFPYINAYSFGEGDIAEGENSITEGGRTKTEGEYTHAEGVDTCAKGRASHSEGEGTHTEAQASHAEGSNTRTHGFAAHAEGLGFDEANGGEKTTFIEKLNDTDKLKIRETYGIEVDWVQPTNVLADGKLYDIYTADGKEKLCSMTASLFDQHHLVFGKYVDGDGWNRTGALFSVDNNSALSGGTTYVFKRRYGAFGNASHTEGVNAFAVGDNSHAEGDNSMTIGKNSHAEGSLGGAYGENSHVEGNANTANGLHSHAEGRANTASGKASHAEGDTTLAIGDYSHAEGYGNVAKNTGQHVSGTYAEIDKTGNAIFQVGIGSNDSTRKDAFRINKDGSFVFAAPEDADAPIFTFLPINEQQEVSAINEDEGEESSGQTSVAVTTSNFRDLIYLQNTIDGINKDIDDINKDIDGIIPEIQGDLDDLKTEFTQIVNDQEKKYNNSITDVLLKTSDLQSQIDGEATAWFLEGAPCDEWGTIDASKEPAKDWDEKGENGKESYDSHKGDTYTNIEEAIVLDSSMWEQGGYATASGNEINNSDVYIRTKDYIESKGDTVYVPNGYEIHITYYDENKEYQTGVGNVRVSFNTNISYKFYRLTLSIINQTVNIAPSLADELKLCINPTAGKSWRFCYCERKTGNGENDKTTDWHWHELGDSSLAKALYEASRAQSTADGKSTVYISKDEDGNRVPDHYQAGDMWIINKIALENGDFDHDKENDIYYTKEIDENGKVQRGTLISVGEMLTANANSKEYNVTHWSKEIKYTDDSYIIEAEKATQAAYAAAEERHKEALQALEKLNEIGRDGRVYATEFDFLNGQIGIISKDIEELVGADGKQGEASLWEGMVDSADEYFNAANSAITALRYYTNTNNYERDAKTQTLLDYIQIKYKNNYNWKYITYYYIARQELLNDIADASKNYSSGIQGISNLAALNASAAQNAAEEAAEGANAALGMLDDVDNDDVVAITEFAALESELEVIGRDLIEITNSIELYNGSKFYEYLKNWDTIRYDITGTTITKIISGRTDSETITGITVSSPVTYSGFTAYQEAQIKAVNALKYHCGKTSTKDGYNIVAGENDKNEHGSIIIKTSKKNNAITTPFEIDYENIVNYYTARQSMLEHIAFVAKLYAESLQAELSPENVQTILEEMKIYGVNLITGSRYDFYMGQWGSTDQLSMDKIEGEYTQTRINEDSKLSFYTCLYNPSNNVDVITNKQWGNKYISASIDIFIPKDNVTEEDKQNPKKVNFGIVLRCYDNGNPINLFSAYTNNIECVYNDWTRLQLTFPMEKDITDVFTKDGKDYLVSNVYLVVYDSVSTYTSGTIFKFRKIQIEFNTTCSSWYPSPYDIDETYSIAVDAQKNADAAMKEANESMILLSDMSSDDKLTPPEKVNIRKEWGEIQEEYEQSNIDVQRVWRDHGFTDPQEYNDYENAYDSLDDCLSLIDIDIDKETTTDISTISGTIFSVKYTGREYFNKAFSTYYAKHVAFMNCLAEQLAYLEVRSIEIGGRNLLRYTDQSNYLSKFIGWLGTLSLSNGWIKVTQNSGQSQVGAVTSKVSKNDLLIKGKEYVLSFDAYLDGSASVSTLDLNYNYLMFSSGSNYSITGTATITTTPERYSINFTYNGENTATFGAMVGSNKTNCPVYYVKNIKLEQGNKATAWSSAPEDTLSQIEEVKTYTKTLGDSLQNQIDGVVNSYFMEGAPCDTDGTVKTTIEPFSEWKGSYEVSNNIYTLKSGEINHLMNHLGDTYTNISSSEDDTTGGQSWRWCDITSITNHESTSKYITVKYTSDYGSTISKNLHWHKIADSDAVKALQAAAAAQDTADSKRRVFTKQPYTPYDVGDLWVKTDKNNSSLTDTLYCHTSQATGDFDLDDWASSTVAQDALNGLNNLDISTRNLAIFSTASGSNVTKVNPYTFKQISSDTGTNATKCNFKILTYNNITPQEVLLNNTGNTTTGIHKITSTLTKTCNRINIGDSGNTKDTLAYFYLPETLYSGDTISITYEVTNATNGSVTFKDVMIVKGNKAVAFQPSPEDIEASIVVGGRNILRDTRSNTFSVATNEFTFKTYTTTVPLKPNSEYVFSVDSTTIHSGTTTGFTFCIYDSTIKINRNTSMVIPISNERKFVKFKTSSSVTSTDVVLIYDGIAGSTSGNSITLQKYKLEEGNVPTEWSAAPEDIDYLQDIMNHGSTEVNGGLVMTNVLGLKDREGNVTGGMSGVEEDNVLLWGGGTYYDATSAAVGADYLKEDGVNKITTLIKKDGTGKIGAFYIDDDTVKVVTEEQQIYITNKSLSGITAYNQLYLNDSYLKSYSDMASTNTGKQESRTGSLIDGTTTFDGKYVITGITLTITDGDKGNYNFDYNNSITYTIDLLYGSINIVYGKLYIYVTSDSTTKYTYTSSDYIISRDFSKSDNTSESYIETETIGNYHSLKNFYLDKGTYKIYVAVDNKTVKLSTLGASSGSYPLSQYAHYTFSETGKWLLYGCDSATIIANGGVAFVKNAKSRFIIETNKTYGNNSGMNPFVINCIGLTEVVGNINTDYNQNKLARLQPGDLFFLKSSETQSYKTLCVKDSE